MNEAEIIKIDYTEFKHYNSILYNDIHYYTLRGYKITYNFDDLGVYSNNYSDAKFLKSFYSEISYITISVNDNLSKEYGSSTYKAYPNWILEDYYGGIIKEIKKVDKFIDNYFDEVNFINDKHQKTRKIATNSYRNQNLKSIQKKLKLPEYTLLELYYWILNHIDYDKLYREWKDSGFNNNLRPSLIMLEWKKPYSFDNLKLVTLYENREYIRKYFSSHAIIGRKIGQYDMEGNLVNKFNSIVEASRKTEAKTKGIHKVLAGTRKTHKGYIWKYL